MEADEWERTVCSERGKEKSFFGEKFSSPLGLCCFFLAASAFFFWSPFVSLTLLFLLAKHAMGAGDIFLSGAAALWLAPVSVPLFLFLSASSAAIAGMVLLFLGRMSRREGIPFCPFIALGGVAAYGAEVFQLPFFPSWHCFI